MLLAGVITFGMRVKENMINQAPIIIGGQRDAELLLLELLLRISVMIAMSLPHLNLLTRPPKPSKLEAESHHLFAK